MVVPLRVRNVVRPYWQRATSPDERSRSREIAKIGPAERWPALQSDELDFWDRVLDANNKDPKLWPEVRATRTNPEMLLQHYLVELIDASVGSRVDILDVGAGPLTYLGKKWPGRDVRIVAVDPNAAEYDKLLAKHGIEPPCRTILGYAEELSSSVPQSGFDLVHARNCIDHSKDALKAIREMVLAVKPGCCVYMDHKISEGRVEKYAGPHQWNFFPKQSLFYVERPGMKPVDVGKNVLREIADVTVGPSPGGAEWFSVTIRRRTPQCVVAEYP